MNHDMHSAGEYSDQLVDGAARASTQALNRAGQAAEQTIESLSDRVEAQRSRVRPALHDLAGGVENLAREGAQALRGQAHQVREKGASYIQEKPIPALLMAAAGGALVAVVSGWMMRNTDSRR
jgi:ElaB/YqjD/DUF883 family membrane-anchored ribosome-binding protein